MSSTRALALATALLLGATTASAQVTTLILEGDNIPGVGNVKKIQNVAVGDSGDWLVQVKTDNSDTSKDLAVVKNGTLFMQEGQSMSAPSGATLQAFGEYSINSAGDTVSTVEINDSGTKDAIYWNDKLLLLEDDVAQAPGFSAGTKYTAIYSAKVNDNDQVAAIVQIDDPNLSASVKQAIVMFDTDGNGNITGETILVKVTDTAGAGQLPIAFFSLFGKNWSFTNNGSYTFKANISAGNSGADEVVNVVGTTVAEEASPSPVAGRAWGNLSSSPSSTNDIGDYVLQAALSGGSADDAVIVKNGVLFMQEGMALAAMGNNGLKSFGTGPIEISSAGFVQWYGQSDDPNIQLSEGLWSETDLIVQGGVTMASGQIIAKLVGDDKGYDFTPNGQLLLFEGELQDGTEGAFSIGIAGGEPGGSMCFGDGSGGTCPCGNNGGTGQGCGNSTGAGGALTASGSSSLAMNNFSFAVSGLPAGKTALLVSSGASSNTVWGDGLLCVGNNWTPHSVAFANGLGNATWGTAQITNQTWGPGSDSYFQVLYRDPSGSCGTFNGSSAYHVTWTP